ncbi:hypothetical protein [Rhodoferax sp.]|uniref:hypothetical protein n=1 Tax=Rhodoferax sp. TaxID=50421 RepID=UPI00374D7359
METLKKSGADKVSVGTITPTANMQGAAAIQLRASSMRTPVGKNYGDYIAAALRTELEMAKLYAPQSETSISAVLIKNNIDAGGFSTSQGQIEARFTVKRGDQVRFEKTKSISHQWESSFAGAVAIPLAANSYPVMVQMLIDKLITDPDFINALKN